VEGVRLIAWEFDPKRKQFLYISHHAEEILGYPLEAWREPGFWYAHLHPEDRERTVAFSREHVSRGLDHDFEYRMLRPNGDVVWLKDLTSVDMVDGKPVMLHGVFIDITERKRSEDSKRQSLELQRMMLSELDHRVRNNLASLSALIDISMRDKSSVQEFAASIQGRVQAMSAVHSLLSRGHWIAVQFRNLVETLTPHDLQGSLTLDGPDIRITPRQVTAMGMVLQELMANSMKYGALSNQHGRVELSWTIDPTPAAHGQSFDMRWRESGGPPIEQTPRPGQGTGLIEGFVRTELRGRVELHTRARAPRTGSCFNSTRLCEPAGCARLAAELRPAHPCTMRSRLSNPSGDWRPGPCLSRD
jgi:PAS domain S-box-containing protein